MTITAPLVALIIDQDTSLPNADEIKGATKIIMQRKTEELTNKSSKIAEKLDVDTERAVIQAKEKGASSWLTVLLTYRRTWRCNSFTLQQDVKRNT